MKTRIFAALVALAATTAAPAQAQVTKAQLDSVRAELVRSRGFIRGAETQLTKSLALLDSLIARMAAAPPAPIDTTTPPPPPVDTTTPAPPPPPPPAPIDSTLRIYAQQDFSGPTLGAFRTVPTPPNTPCNFNGEAGRCSDATWLRNGRFELFYARLDTASSNDRNRAIEWRPKDASEFTPYGGTIYMGATYFIPKVTPADRAVLDSAAARFGVPATTDTTHKRALRKLVYSTPGMNTNPNHWVLAVHAYALRFSPPVKNDNGTCVATGSQVYTVHVFNDAELFDRPLRLEVMVKRSSGVMQPDGEFWVWIDGRLARHQTGVCTNRTDNTFWNLEIGQQYNAQTDYTMFRELRAIDDVIVANKRPN